MKKDIFILDQSDIPKEYYNINEDLPVPMSPPLNPTTREPIAPEDLSPLFPMELIKQDVSQDPYIRIPEEVLELYARFRPTPIYRARRLVCT